MRNQVRVYRATIWTRDSTRPGLRVTVLAETLDEAKEKLEVDHGQGTVFDLHCEEDAEKPR